MFDPIQFTHAVCRRPCEALAAGLTTSELGAPEYSKALQQHEAYVATLRKLGLDVTVLDPEPDFPDAHFVEDTAVVSAKVAVITRPGHTDRRGEERTIGPVLALHRPLERIVAPGTVDGGDVLMVANHFLIGISERTNEDGARQLGEILARYGHTFQTVPVAAGLHFKSSVNEVGGKLLVTADFAGRQELREHAHILVPRGEEYAANTLRINDHLITPDGYPGTLAELKRLKMGITVLDLSEMRKMDGGLTCLSLRF